MTRFRYVTPHRAGKWYANMRDAQAHAYRIGAGFLDKISGKFVAYRETRMEQSELAD